MHWFIVASQKEARIFIKTLEREQLKLLKTLTNPLGSVKRRDLIKKEAGQGVKSVGHVGGAHYSQPKRHDPHEEAVVQFAKQVSKFLEGERLKKNFKSLAIVAEPNLLGKLRAEMATDLKNSVTDWIKKDLQKTPKKELVNFLLPKRTISASADTSRVFSNIKGRNPHEDGKQKTN